MTENADNTIERAGKWAWLRTRQLDGTLSKDPMVGVFQLSYMRLRRGWGEIDDWDLDSDADPSTEDSRAHHHRIASYSRVWTFEDCRRTIERGCPVSASFFVTSKWKNPPQGRLDFEQDHLPLLGGHCMQIVPSLARFPAPLDWDEDTYVLSPNSWGESWGNAGWAAITKEFFGRYMYSAWAFEPKAERPIARGRGIQFETWVRGAFPDRVLLAAEFINADTQESVAWILYVVRKGAAHIEDLYVKPNHRGNGYGRHLLAYVLHECEKKEIPVQLWIDFADIDVPSKVEHLKQWLSAYPFRIERSPFAWAAYTATFGEPVAEWPTVEVPPKPTYVFPREPAAPISDERLSEIATQHGVSAEFMQHLKHTVTEHASVLRRLA
ncbi:MAG: GNAT family N-acetyltransferase [Pirellulales bacterium]